MIFKPQFPLDISNMISKRRVKIFKIDETADDFTLRGPCVSIAENRIVTT